MGSCRSLGADGLAATGLRDRWCPILPFGVVAAGARAKVERLRVD